MTPPEDPAPAVNPVHSLTARAEAAFAKESAAARPAQAERRSRNPFQAALRRFLQAAEWSGERRRILEVLPYQQPIADLETLRAVLHRLGFETRAGGARLHGALAAHTPCIAMIKGRPIVILGREGEQSLRIYDPDADEERVISAAHERVLLLRVRAAAPPQFGDDKKPWMTVVLGQLKSPILLVFLMSLVVNLIGLATPVFTAAVYDLVIRPGALDTLGFLFAAAAFALGFEWALRQRRSRIIAELGARFDAALTSAVFQKLLAFPLRMTEGAPVATQVMRLRDFEKIRAIFQGNLMNALLDLPFLAVFVAVIFFYGGWLGLVPVGLAVCYGLLWVATASLSNRKAIESGQSGNALQGLLMEAVAKRATVQGVDFTSGMADRVAEAARDVSAKRFEAQYLENVLHTICQSLGSIAGASTLGIGALMVMDGALSMGGLIAVMMLIWRVITPIQTAFLSHQRLSQFLQGVQQVNRLLALPQERRRAVPASVARKMEGEIAAENISYRYANDQDPALRGVSLKINPGEIVAISGPTGSGKSTLLKLLAGLYEPMGGGVFVDGVNLRNLDPSEHRAALGYAPQRPVLFHGALSQNLRLFAPAADDTALLRSLQAAGLDPKGAMFPEGLASWIKTGGRQFDDAVRTKIMLAGLYAKRAPLYLLDDPGAFLDAEGDAAMIKRLNAFRGKVTVVLVTNRPSHMRVADRVIVLEQGAVAADGPADKVIAALERAGRIHYRNVNVNKA